MRTTYPPLPIFRSAAQARLLAAIFLDDEHGEPLTTLARRAGVGKSQAFRELERLESAGVVTSDRVGNVRLVRPDRASPYYDELRSLLLKAFGPITVLERTLQTVDGVEAAYVFGSWAALYLGESDRSPRDIDLLVIGEPNRDAVDHVCRMAEQHLGREVNATVVSRENWEAADSGFLQTLKSRPLVPIIGDDD